MFDLLFNTKKKEMPQLQPKPKKQAKVLAVRSHADWCEYSRALAPEFENLKNRFDGKEVLFITLDFTNSTTKYQSDLLAVALGIETITKQIRSTGFILLIDFESRMTFAKLNLRMKFREMVSLVEEKLKAEEVDLLATVKK